MSDAEKYKGMINDALVSLGTKTADEIRPIAWDLFMLIYDDLQKAIVGNPIEHHLIVLKHMMEIANEERSPYIINEQAAALALLHDISAVDKITTQMVVQARLEEPAKGDALELKRQQNRILHMREGCAIANRRMLQLNERQGRIVFDAQAIDTVCEVIRIHDNPSLDIPIPRNNWLAVAFREADRLWMITHEGILADLTRKKKDPKNIDVYRKQVAGNIERFRDERSLYRPFEQSEGPFCDDETFFRTKTGYAIFQRLHKERKNRDSSPQVVWT